MKAPKSPLVRNILSALAVSFFGFALWNLAFIILAGMVRIPLLLLPGSVVETMPRLMPYVLVLFIALLTVLGWWVFRSSLPDLFKATYLTMPLVVVLTGIGVMTYPNPRLSYGLCTAVVAAVLAALVITKRPWIYYYATLYTAITLLIFTLAGGEI